MKLFQIVVFTAVLFGNIHFEWIKNGYAASLGAAIAAYYATLILVTVVGAARGWGRDRAGSPSLQRQDRQAMRQLSERAAHS